LVAALLIKGSNPSEKPNLGLFRDFYPISPSKNVGRPEGPGPFFGAKSSRNLEKALNWASLPSLHPKWGEGKILALSEEGAGIFLLPNRKGRLDSSLHAIMCVGSNPTCPLTGVE